MNEQSASPAPEPRGDKAAKLLNLVMFIVLALIVLAFGLWNLAFNVERVVAILKGLTPAQQRDLINAFGSLCFVLVGSSLLWRSLKTLRKGK